MRFLFTGLLCAILTHAQAQPFQQYQSMNYQAVVRNAGGTPLPNQTVGVQFTIAFGLAFAYQETQTLTSDGSGVISARIGLGTPTGVGQFATFDEIDWNGAVLWNLLVAVDLTGGTNYGGPSSAALVSVPFALMAKEAKTLMDSTWVSTGSGDYVYSHPTTRVGLGVEFPVNKLDVEGAAVIGAAYSGTSTAPANGLLVQGNVGIGTNAPGAFGLLVNGSAAKPGGGSWSNSSDLRLKKNVAPLTGSLNTLLGLRGVTFEYKDPAAIHELPGTRIGFIAQEVEQVIPDWVEEVDGYKRLTIRGFEALTVEALRELQAENAGLRAEVEALRDQQARVLGALERAEARLEAIEHGTAPVKAER